MYRLSQRINKNLYEIKTESNTFAQYNVNVNKQKLIILLYTSNKQLEHKHLKIIPVIYNSIKIDEILKYRSNKGIQIICRKL